MELDKEIPFTTEEGYQYLVSFVKFSANGIDYGIPIIDVSITLMNSEIEYNSIKTLNIFVGIINNYLDQHNVVLYYYCDTSAIKMRTNRKEKLLPQEYRSKLFSSMFNKKKFDDYILTEIRINDPERGDHFTSLISSANNTDKIRLIEDDLKKFNK
ncbi:hypothetical protein [Flavobacterium ginsenosidimutans]|uniref:hypothetical protein n=1 Tax=Flavobacterium ginsenosidimutans TaxID=687844 RepID=UPI000DAB5329|nr:hypothetical protein [Flavobacterium ginsenosidimutans]KAF2330556.1 hypothetical protein DM444_14530 [Flavobacterium ginsenosidimutans]